MTGVFYPDAGGQYDDRSVLRNAVVFTTAQRARAAARVYGEPFDRLGDIELAMTAVDAFQQWVQTSEDSLGWLFALREWNPGSIDRSLFALLDAIRVGRDPWTENAAVSLLEGMSVSQFRAGAHLPSNTELLELGWSKDLVERVEPSLEGQLEGFRRIAERRARGDRSLVRAYNKSKHHLLAMLAHREGKLEVDLFTSTSGYKDPAKIVVTGARISTDPKTTKQRARDVLQMQAVLNSMLAMILRARYGESFATPDWVSGIYDLGGWRDD